MTPTEMRDLATAENRTEYGTLSDGTPVFSKQGVSHLANHADVLPLLPELFGMLTGDFAGQNLSRVLDCGRIIGNSSCVETTGDDTIVYRRRKGRKDGVTRFVANRSPRLCSTAVVRLFRNDAGLIVLMTAFIGDDSPAEPCSPTALKNRTAWDAGNAFWSTHALVLDDDVEAQVFTESDFFVPFPG